MLDWVSTYWHVYRCSVDAGNYSLLSTLLVIKNINAPFVTFLQLMQRPLDLHLVPDEVYPTNRPVSTVV